MSHTSATDDQKNTSALNVSALHTFEAFDEAMNNFS